VRVPGGDFLNQWREFVDWHYSSPISTKVSKPDTVPEYQSANCVQSEHTARNWIVRNRAQQLNQSRTCAVTSPTKVQASDLPYRVGVVAEVSFDDPVSGSS
jgi:hypothetical protein